MNDKNSNEEKITEEHLTPTVTDEAVRRAGNRFVQELSKQGWVLGSVRSALPICADHEQLRADLERVTQERNEARAEVRDADDQAGEIHQHYQDALRNIERIAAERDALQATLDAERKQFDIERTSIIDADKRSRALGRVWEVLDRRGLLASDDIADDVAAALDRAQATLDDLRAAARELLALKDSPRDEDYQRRKPLAWQALRAALDSVPTPPQPLCGARDNDLATSRPLICARPAGHPFGHGFDFAEASDMHRREIVSDFLDGNYFEACSCGWEAESRSPMLADVQRDDSAWRSHADSDSVPTQTDTGGAA